MARKGHVIGEMARKGRTTGRRQTTQAVHGNAGAPSPAALKFWELFVWFAILTKYEKRESDKHHQALPSATNTSLRQQIGLSDLRFWQSPKNANQTNQGRVCLIRFAYQRNHQKVWFRCFANSLIRGPRNLTLNLKSYTMDHVTDMVLADLETLGSAVIDTKRKCPNLMIFVHCLSFWKTIWIKFSFTKNFKLSLVISLS